MKSSKRKAKESALSPGATEQASPAYMTCAQAGVYSGLGAWLIRQAIRRGELTGYRPTRARTLVSRAELDGWVRAGAGGESVRATAKAKRNGERKDAGTLPA